jgi:Zn-dependent peptidase ImmA (M78 family)
MSIWPVADAPSTSLLSRAEDLATTARDALAVDNEALAIRSACRAARVSVIRRALGVGARRHTAMLVPTTRGFNAVVDSQLWDRAESGDAPRRHLRFVVAHELGHTFFYRPGEPPSRSSAPDRLEERFCDHFATFLLVPPASARSAPLEPSGLYSLAHRYDVSKYVAAWAIARAWSVVSILMFGRSEHPRGGREAMRLQWGASEHFLARGESFKSPLADLAPGEQGSCSQRLRLGGRDHDVELSAWRLRSSLLVIARHNGTSATSNRGSVGMSVAPPSRHLTLFP